MNLNIFKVYSSPKSEAEVIQYRIFDRWGELIYDVTKPFSIHNNDFYWKGGGQNEESDIAIFVFDIKVLNICSGEITHLTGDVTLLK